MTCDSVDGPESAGTYKLKCVVVGDSEVGKSCLLDKFWTENVATEFDKYDAVVQFANDRKVHLILGDTSGLKDYDRIRPLSYQDTNIFLVCFSLVCKISLDNVLDKWIPEIEHNSPNTPAILVGTKADLRDDPTQEGVVTSEEAINVQKRINKEFRINCCGYYECSSRTQKGVREVFEEASRIGLKKPKKVKKKCTIS